METLSEILKDNKFTPDDVPELEAKFFFEGERLRPYLVRFSVLLFLSTVIAAQGVIEDSAATVIGAMIIAPLMTPILATTAALTMGNGSRAWRSLLLVVAGTLGVIATATVLGLLAVHVLDFNTNSQITARVSPRVIDLFIALAAGTAGAFATSRDDIADSIPGVAISIALVPPLCVVGLSFAAGHFDAAWGALLLFLTNFLSILLAGGLVFAVLGLGPAAIEGMGHLNRRRAYQVVACGVILVAIPLVITTVKVGRESIAQARVTEISDRWMRQYPSDIVLQSVLVSGQRARVIVTGPERPLNVDDLGSKIAAEVGWIESVDFRYVPSLEHRYPEDRSK